MANFTIRVELNTASHQGYSRLHAQMDIAGFSRTIRGDDGRIYHLPPAEYNLENSHLSAEQVRDWVGKLMQVSGCRGNILVTEALRRAWSLDPVAPSLPTGLGALANLLPSSISARPHALSGLSALSDLTPRTVLGDWMLRQK